jgi:hypothetical protein
VPELLKTKDGFREEAFVPLVKLQEEVVPQLVAA